MRYLIVMNKFASWTFPLLLGGCMSPGGPKVSMLSSLEQRLHGDRSGACVAAALIDHGAVERATACADPSRMLSGDRAFEIGSISKTMTAFLLAGLIAEGKLSLDDPLSKFLPAGTAVPSFEGQPIRLAHLVTHTAGLPGLPPRFAPAVPDDPYADATPELAIGSLADVALTSAPGSAWAYSNYGFMLLSHVIVSQAGADFESLLRARLFAPLGMKAYIAEPPAGVQLTAGHTSNGAPAKPWNLPGEIAGIGGVRATLDDMIRYAAALLGDADEPVRGTLARTLQPIVSQDAASAMGMAWVRETVGDRPLWLHDGGTGGFSSLIALDVERGRAVIALSDTSFTSTGGLTELALDMLIPGVLPLASPRTKAAPSLELVSALAGRYLVADVNLELSVREGSLIGAAQGQVLNFSFDSYGDFYPLEIDALLTPVKLADGRTSFVWKQAGAQVRAERLP